MPRLLMMVGGAGVGLGATVMVGEADSGEGGGVMVEGAGRPALFCGKRGVVFELAGAPVTGGAVGLGRSGAEGGLAMVGIGLVTAADHAGGAAETGASSNWPEALRGRVVAAEIFGRGVGMILVEAGLSGRGGRLMRSVSRLGAFGSAPGLAESAIIKPFYSYFGKCSMAKFAIVT